MMLGGTGEELGEEAGGAYQLEEAEELGELVAAAVGSGTQPARAAFPRFREIVRPASSTSCQQFPTHAHARARRWRRHRPASPSPRTGRGWPPVSSAPSDGMLKVGCKDTQHRRRRCTYIYSSDLDILDPLSALQMYSAVVTARMRHRICTGHRGAGIQHPVYAGDTTDGRDVLLYG